MLQAAVPTPTPSEIPQPVSYYANPVALWESHSSNRPARTIDLVQMIAQIFPSPSGPSLPTPTPTPIVVFPTPTPIPITPERLELLQQADFNRDGIINALDLLLFQSVWLEEVPSQ